MNITSGFSTVITSRIWEFQILSSPGQSVISIILLIGVRIVSETWQVLEYRNPGVRVVLLHLSTLTVQRMGLLPQIPTVFCQLLPLLFSLLLFLMLFLLLPMLLLQWWDGASTGTSGVLRGRRGGELGSGGGGVTIGETWRK
jgi:hypothetical protein